MVRGHREGELKKAFHVVKVGNQKTEQRAALKNTVKHTQVSAMKQLWKARMAVSLRLVLSE